MNKNSEKLLTTEIKRSADTILQEVVKGTASVIGKDFFSALVENLASALGVRNCAVTYQAVVDQHNDKLYCQSGETEGAEFVIEIPIQLETVS